MGRRRAVDSTTAPHTCPHCGGFLEGAHATIELGGAPAILAALRQEIADVLRRVAKGKSEEVEHFAEVSASAIEMALAGVDLDATEASSSSSPNA